MSSDAQEARHARAPAGATPDGAEPLAITLDRASSVPLHHQVASAIEAAIGDGRLTAGQLLEKEVALAARLGISRATAR
jgi:hypothetical protein